jgi:hypothetical protein
VLRRDLRGAAMVAASPARGAAWQLLGRLEDRLRARTHRNLEARRPATPQRLVIDRSEGRDTVADVLRAAGQSTGVAVVHGEPDVGKSALVLDAIDALRADGAAVVALSLRDLPYGSLLDVEHHLGGSAREVLAATAVAPVRLLVLDGAEVAQEGAAAVLTDLTRAAVQAGLGVAAVVRDDARRTVVAAVSTSVDAAVEGAVDAGTATPTEVAVPPLTAEQVAQVKAAYAEVSRLGADPRTTWLIRRVGVIDVLLRAEATAALPDGALSEADVFDAVWSTWVRRGERFEPGGATPDGREAALVELARRELVGDGPTAPTRDGQALASLRADGLLLPAGQGFAWRPRDVFASDIMRDFAVARLLLRDEFAPLAAAGAPRWTLRAARLACQSALAVMAGDPVAVEPVRQGLQRRFDVVAGTFGDRWSDVPWEALLTTGFADAGLTGARQALLDADAAGLARVMRLVEQRFTRSDAADPVIAGPVVAFLLDHAGGVDDPRYPTQKTANEFVAAWLRGLIRRPGADPAAPGSMPLRVRVREALLARDLHDGYEVLLESVALLGPDLDVRGRSTLRDIAGTMPGFLARCVEEVDAVTSLADADVELLVELAEAYYLQQPYTDPWGGSPLLPGDVIRSHRAGGGPPWAAWHFGPFWQVLCTNPTAGIGLINRLLAHAARHRVRPDGAPPTASIPDEDLLGVTLDLPGVGPQHYVGDEHVWAWYRGTSIGPWPCTSALRALERAADQLLQAGVPLRRIMEMLLADAVSLAELGLVVGVLVRHLDTVGDELDVFLASPDIWQLEYVRVVSEGGIRVARDSDDAQEAALRRWTFRDVAGVLVIRALASGDQQRVEALRQTGRALVDAARDDRAAHADDREQGAAATGGPADDTVDHCASPPTTSAAEGDSDSRREETVAGGPDAQALASVRLWASLLDADTWHRVEVGGMVGWQHVPPAEVTSALGARQVELDRAGDAWRLLGAYRMQLVPPLHDQAPPVPAAELLAADLTVARELATTPPVGGPPEPDQAPAAVAAAAVRAYAAGVAVAPGDLAWAIGYVILAARHPEVGPFGYEGTIYSAGADRSAATAVPLLLLPAFTDPAPNGQSVDDIGAGILTGADGAPSYCRGSEDEPDQTVEADKVTAVADALVALTTSLFDQVRRFAAQALPPVWQAPCGHQGAGETRCRHEIAWTAVEAGARDVGIGTWNGTTRPRVSLAGPLTTALTSAEAGNLYLTRLTGPLVAACAAARSPCCVSVPAAALRDALLDAYARATLHWAANRFEHRDESRRTAVAALLDDAAAEPTAEPGIAVAPGGGADRLLNHIQRCAAHPRALGELLGDCAVLATYDPARRRTIRTMWPTVMDTVLAAFDPAATPGGGYHRTGRAVASIIPEPKTSIIDTDMTATVRSAHHGWPTPTELAEPIQRWLPWATGQPEGVDALVGLLRAATPAEQAHLGLPWVTHLVRDHPNLIANRTWHLCDWLATLRDADVLDPSTRPQYQALVDALAAAGDRRAARLQRDDEAA